MPSPQSLSNKSKKNRNAIKIQAVFRGRKTRRKLQVLQQAKIKDEAERLFGKVNKSKAKQAIIDMGRDVDQERIEYMIGELFIELKHENPKIYASWLAKAKKKLSK